MAIRTLFALAGVVLVATLDVTSAQRMTLINSPYTFRLGEYTPTSRCLDVGVCRDAVAYLPPGTFLRWCGWSQTRCLNYDVRSSDDIQLQVDVRTTDSEGQWSSTFYNYTQRYEGGVVAQLACNGTSCKRSYGPNPGLPVTQSYCLLVIRPPANASQQAQSAAEGNLAGVTDAAMVRYRMYTGCSSAGTATAMAWLMLMTLAAALLLNSSMH